MTNNQEFKAENYQPILVTGTHRSGTNMLNRVLNAHPNIAMLEIQSDFLRIDPADYRCSIRSLKKLAESAEKEGRTLDNNISNSAGVEEFYFNLILGHLNLKKKKPIGWGEKTAGRNIEALKFLDVTKNGKIIHLTRDPRQVCASEKLRIEKLGVDPTRFLHLNIAYDWVIGIKIAKHCLQHAPHRILTLRYEDFVENPTTSLENICDFLKLKFKDDMLQPKNLITQSGHKWSGNSSIERNFEGITKFNNYYSEVLSDDEVKFIELMCSELMREYGYTIGLKSEFKNLLIGLLSKEQRKIAKIVKSEVEGWVDHIAHRPYENTSIPRLDFQKISKLYRFVF